MLDGDAAVIVVAVGRVALLAKQKGLEVSCIHVERCPGRRGWENDIRVGHGSSSQSDSAFGIVEGLVIPSTNAAQTCCKEVRIYLESGSSDY